MFSMLHSCSAPRSRYKQSTVAHFKTTSVNSSSKKSQVFGVRYVVTCHRFCISTLSMFIKYVLALVLLLSLCVALCAGRQRRAQEQSVLKNCFLFFNLKLSHFKALFTFIHQDFRRAFFGGALFMAHIEMVTSMFLFGVDSEKLYCVCVCVFCFGFKFTS